ncbi:MAG: phosphate regulon sensor histidine kinase PhoR [Lysobacterales bacterium]
MNARHGNWTHQLGRLSAGIAAAVLIGWLLGEPLVALGLFLLACLAWQMYNSLRLYRWLQSPEAMPPESRGMWAEIFDRIAALQKLNLKRNRQYQAVIDDFAGMTDAFPDATLVIDKNDVIRWFNGSAVKLLGLKTPTDQGQAVTNLIRDPRFANWLAVQDRLPSKLEIACPADDNITLQVNSVRFRKDHRLLILRDVTDIENLERMRRDLVANVSHELRTPLTVLLGYLEMLRDQPEAVKQKNIDRMLQQARQMNDLIADLLELSRLQEANGHDDTDEVDVPAMLAQLEKQARDVSQGKHVLQFDIQAGLNMKAVAADLKSAFQNLIVNAIRYTPEGGSIYVTWQQEDDKLVFSVRDTGVGIPRRDIPRITERFYRVGSDRNRQNGGTGLGLAIVKHVLNSHGGHLEIDSELGGGSEFRCVFPLSGNNLR